MTEQPVGEAPSVREGWTVRVWFAAVSTVLAFVLIGILVRFGDPANVLHQSALNSSFYVVFGVLAGFGVGAIAPQLSDIFKK